MSESPMDQPDSTGSPYPHMSENQHEEVEDYVRYNRAHLVQPLHMTETSPDNYVQQPSTSNQRGNVAEEVCYQQPHLVQPLLMTETSPDNYVFYHQQPSSSNQHGNVAEVCYQQPQLAHPQQMTNTSPDNPVFYQQQPSSSNQRGNVAEEVCYQQPQLAHPQQMTNTSPDNSLFYQQQPSSSNQHVTSLNYGYNNNGELNAYTPDGYAYSNPGQSFDPANTDLVFSTTTVDHRQSLDPVPVLNSLLATSLPMQSWRPPSYAANRDIDLLHQEVSEAYYKTTMDIFQINRMMKMSRPQDNKRVSFSKMARDKLWLACTERLTSILEQIVQFAKMVPGFMKLSQDVQIVLLKSGCFKLSIIQMSRYYDLHTNCVLFGDRLLPKEAFITSDPMDRKLVHDIFKLAKWIAEKGLKYGELGLFSAFVLLSPDCPEQEAPAEIQKMKEDLLKSLRRTLGYHTVEVDGELPILNDLVASINDLHEVNLLHTMAFNNLQRKTPHKFMALPRFYREVFTWDEP